MQRAWLCQWNVLCFFLFFVLKNKRSSLLLQHNKTYWIGHWLGALLCLDTWDHIACFIPGYKCHGFYHLYLIFTGAGFCLYNSNNFYGILGYCWVLWCTNKIRCFLRASSHYKLLSIHIKDTTNTNTKCYLSQLKFTFDKSSWLRIILHSTG